MSSEGRPGGTFVRPAVRPLPLAPAGAGSTGSSALPAASSLSVPRASYLAVCLATSFEVMSRVSMKPLVPLNSKAFGPTR